MDLKVDGKSPQQTRRTQIEEEDMLIDDDQASRSSYKAGGKGANSRAMMNRRSGLRSANHEKSTSDAGHSNS